ncbi:succinyldiaminopimelate transaminase [Reinekea sp.]|jgi:N-succinyldiaminopimelate aminotransferase|uniref:succinyldiaminopimelate transaminase n=1 Tax=Reinekea sp. TaxID=1970455 RepID=UPI002A830C91|nr:succinyldiaminopimelate transaminase [Reinekea sp.]
MNPNLKRLQPYPFEKLRAQMASVTAADLRPIAWSIGEPKHAPPAFLHDQIVASIAGYSSYPATAGLPALRAAIANWLVRRFQLHNNQNFSADRHVIPVTGTREALFAAVQAFYDPSASANEVWMPNPFYQIYEGAALLAGATLTYLNCVAEHDYQPDYASISDEQWSRCQILFICTPGNPSGTVMSSEQLQFLIKKAIQFDFILLSDECYSELYRDESRPPVGLLQAAEQMGHTDFEHCLVFHSLSKRSNLPGLRSGFVAGDAHLIRHFSAYRTYHGCAMPVPHQQVSIAAWNDESHVLENRRLYNEKFNAVVGELKSVLPLTIPDGSFYLWPDLAEDDTLVAQRWLEQANIHILPGQYLSRQNAGINPGYGHVRIALVATLDDCVEAARRLKRLY